MKLLICHVVFFAFCATVSLSKAEKSLQIIPDNGDSAPGTVIKLGSTVPILPEASLDCSGIYTSKCKDCTTFVQCAGSTNPIKTQKCANDVPFCNNGKCSTVPTTDADGKICTTTSDIICTSEGFFPDPESCSKYNYCASPGAQPTVYQCPPGFVYNSANHNCRKKPLLGDCYTIECPDSESNKFVLYKPNNAYYAFCQNTEGIKSTIVFKCEDEVNFVFDTALLGCSFKCKTEGHFPDRLDCKSYYTCYKQGSILQFVHATCPTGYAFVQDKCMKNPEGCKNPLLK